MMNEGLYILTAVFVYTLLQKRSGGLTKQVLFRRRQVYISSATV
jgi:hypothetical protein